MKSRKIAQIALVVVIVLGYWLQERGWIEVAPQGSAREETTGIDRARAERRSDVIVTDAGEVVKVLSDDTEGSRHQRFIVRLPSGSTVLVSHNIDLAPRVESLKRGTWITLKGEYEWNDKGGVVHWTHHDPQNRHPDGWLEVAGRRYE